MFVLLDISFRRSILYDPFLDPNAHYHACLLSYVPSRELRQRHVKLVREKKEMLAKVGVLDNVPLVQFL